MKQADHSTFELKQVSGMLSDLFKRHIVLQPSTDRPCCFSQALRFMRSTFLLIKLVAHVGNCKGIRHMLVSVLACYIVVHKDTCVIRKTGRECCQIQLAQIPMRRSEEYTQLLVQPKARS